MTDNLARVSAAWLGLREPADAAARVPELVDLLRRDLPVTPRTVIHDLGSGTGSMGRWLAPQLPGPQHWVLYDRDPDLLIHAEAETAGTTAADGAPVTVETRQHDITRLSPADLDGAALITASALLDMLTADEVERVVASCAEARCPALLTLSVIGRVELTPADPLDAEIEAAFNAHQRRTVGGRTLLGPDAVEATIEAFGRHGADVLVRSSPWRLGPDQADLTCEWLQGWLDAAYEQRQDLSGSTAAYASRRLTEATEGRLGAVVEHHDLLARWR